jgi:hypothetical protein
MIRLWNPSSSDSLGSDPTFLSLKSTNPYAYINFDITGGTTEKIGLEWQDPANENKFMFIGWDNYDAMFIWDVFDPDVSERTVLIHDGVDMAIGLSTGKLHFQTVTDQIVHTDPYLTKARVLDLTDGGSTTLHKHDAALNGTYELYIGMFPDFAGNFAHTSPTTNSWGGGAESYIIVTASDGSARWDLGKIIPPYPNTKTVTITQVETIRYDTGSQTLTFSVTRRPQLSSNVNRAAVVIASGSGIGSVPFTNIKRNTLAVSHAMLTGQNYSLLITMTYPGSNAHRLMGIKLTYTVS